MSGVDEQLLAELVPELEAAGPVVLELLPAEAFAVVGALQLALRHPDVPAGPAAVARSVVDAIAEQSGPAVRRAIALGEARQFRPAEPGGQQLLPPEIRDRIAEMEARPSTIARLLDVAVDERMPPDTLVVFSGDPAHPERGGDAVVVQLGDRSPAVVERARPDGIVRPAGLVWSGIRVDELPGLYEICGPDHPDCPALEDGEIYGHPVTGRIFVWSRVDFERLVGLSRFLHDMRRRAVRAGIPELSRGERAVAAVCEDAIGLANAGADAIAIVRALPAGEGGTS